MTKIEDPSRPRQNEARSDQDEGAEQEGFYRPKEVGDKEVAIHRGGYSSCLSTRKMYEIA